MFGIANWAQEPIDKGEANVSSSIGEYDYDCPMDKHLFEFLGIDGAKLLDVIKNAKSDAEIEAYAKPFVEKKSAGDIPKVQRSWVKHGPTSPGTRRVTTTS